MRKTRFEFGSQGMILNVFFCFFFLQKSIFEKYLKGTRDPPLYDKSQISIFLGTLPLDIIITFCLKILYLEIFFSSKAFPRLPEMSTMSVFLWQIIQTKRDT